MKMKRVLAMVVLALMLAAVLIPVSAYAKTGDRGINKVDGYYAVDTVTNETTVDGILIQTIERRFIPDNRYNPNNPTVPYNSNNGWWDNNGSWHNGNQNWNQNPNNNWNWNNGQSRSQTLRNAGQSSLNSIVSYANSRKWKVTTRENYCNDSEFSAYLYCRCDYSSRYDYVDIEFTESTVFDGNGNAITRYYNNGVSYTENDLKSMFDKSY